MLQTTALAVPRHWLWTQDPMHLFNASSFAETPFSPYSFLSVETTLFDAQFKCYLLDIMLPDLLS